MPKLLGKRVTLNVSGTRFVTQELTLNRFPNTLLGNPETRRKYFVNETNEYYFPRDSHIFDYILFFYQSNGILSKPRGISESAFKKEVNFFQLLRTGQSNITNRVVLSKWKRGLNKMVSIDPALNTRTGLITCFKCFVLFISSISYSLQTDESNTFYTVWLIIEILSALWFNTEYAFHLIYAKNKINYIFSFLGMVDLAGFAPFYAEKIYLMFANEKNNTAFVVLRVAQTIRVIKVARYVKSLQLMANALYDCHGQLVALLSFALLACFLFSCVLFDAEYKENPNIKNMLDTFWFSVITMTTVGYEDVAPATTLGKVIACAIIFTGILTLVHLFLPVYLSYFCMLYENNMMLEAIRKTEKSNRESVRSDTTDDKAITPYLTRASPSYFSQKESSEMFLEQLYYVKRKE